MPYEFRSGRVFVMCRTASSLARTSRIAHLRQTAGLHLVDEAAVVVLPRAEPRERLADSRRFALVVQVDDDVAQGELEHDGHRKLALGDSAR